MSFAWIRSERDSLDLKLNFTHDYEGNYTAKLNPI
jgi:hypothetical protein